MAGVTGSEAARYAYLAEGNAKQARKRLSVGWDIEESAQDWDAIKPDLRYCFPESYQDRLVKDLGFWNLLKDQVSQEGLLFLADAGGYYSNTINWNAAEAL